MSLTLLPSVGVKRHDRGRGRRGGGGVDGEGGRGAGGIRCENYIQLRRSQNTEKINRKKHFK